jgi:serine/threonine-protein phosphatase PPG1
MHHILRAHQLCMEGYSSLFDKHLSTVWSAPNYCYRCGNSASILEVGPGGSVYFNVFEAAPENERDGPTQQAQNAGGKVCFLQLSTPPQSPNFHQLPEYFL